MSSFEPNFTVVGNPTISDDYILTYTDENNYLSFNNAGLLDTSKDIDILFRLQAESSMYEEQGLLQIGDEEDLDNSIAIFYYYGSIGVRFGQNYVSSYDTAPDDFMYYKFSYIASTNILYLYKSEDGADWELLSEEQLWNAVPVISVLNNKIGAGREYETKYITFVNLDVSSIKISSNGSLWYQALDKQYQPTVKAKKVYVSANTFKGNKSITAINCNNATFLNNNMSKAFANCSNLTKITNISENVTNLSYTFAGLPTSFYNYNFPTIPNTVQDISGLFAYHTDWTDIPVQAFLNAWNKVPTHLQTNVAGFLDGCTNLSNVPSNTLPDFMTNISNGFRNCRSMPDMPIITGNIQDMSGAFNNCTTMVNANYAIPNSVTNMADAFANCRVLANAPSLANANNVVNMHNTFYYCNNIKTIDKISNTVNDLSNAFYCCRNLTSIPATIPNSVTNMSGSFYYCSNITAVPTLSNAVTNMNYAFYQCFNITSVPAIPNSVVDLDYGFAWCNNVTSIASVSNSIVTARYAFANTRITSLPTLPETLKNANGMFINCYNITSTITLPESIEDMSYMFQDCNRITTVTKIPNNAINMVSTFNNCTLLNCSLTIPSNVINLQRTFGECRNLATTPNLDNVTNCKDMSYCFRYCRNITSTPNIPSSVTNMSGTFIYTNISNMPTLPANVQDLSYTFQDCQLLVNSTNIPANVQNVIGLFMGCTNMRDFPRIPDHITNMFEVYYNCQNLIVAQELPTSVKSINGTYWSSQSLRAAPYLYNTIEDYTNSFRNTSNVYTSPVISVNASSLNGTFYNARNICGDVFVLSSKIKNASSCFYNTSGIKNVYFPTVIQESYIQPLYCWNCTNESDSTDKRNFYLSDEYSNIQYGEGYSNIPVYYVNGTKVPKLYAQIYKYSSLDMYVRDDNGSQSYRGKRDTENDTEVTIQAGTETTSSETFKEAFNNVVNVTKVGSPTINNGIASSFGDSKYLTVNTPITTSKETKIYLKVTCPTSASTNYPRILSFTTGNCTVYLNHNTGIIGFNNGSSDKGHTESNFFGKTVWIRMIIGTSSTTVSVTLDNDYSINNLASWESSATWETITDSEDFRTIATDTIYLGNNGQSGRYFPGSIDLNNCRIYTNRQITWNGIDWDKTINLKDIHENVLEDKNDNEINGTLTVNNYIASGFSSTNYIAIPPFRPGNKSWEMQFKLTYNSSGTNEQFIIGNTETAYQGIVFSIHGGKFHLYCDSAPNSSGRFIGSISQAFTFVSGNTYWIKISFDGTNKYLSQVSEDYKTWTTLHDVTNSSTVYNTSEKRAIGKNRTENAWSGSIDLRDSYIKIGNELFWTGDNNNFIKYGMLSDNNGVISNFARNNYIFGKGIITYTDNWEIVTKVNTQTLRNSNNWIISSNSNSNRNICWGIISTKKMRLFLSSNGVDWDIAQQVDGTTTFSNNTEYKFKLAYNGTEYIASYSIDNGETWIPEITVTSDVRISAQKICIGTNESQSNWFGGSIDLKETYVKVDDVIVWKPYYKNYYEFANRNFIIYGSPKIVNKTISNFNSDNYIFLPESFNPGSNPWEWQFKFKTGSSVNGSDQLIGGPDIEGNCGLEFGFRNSHFALWVGSSLSSYDIINGVRSEYTILPNTTYWVKIYFTGTEYKLDYSTDGISYTNAIIASSSTAIYGYGKCIGTDLNNPINTRFRGSIDLEQTYIKINNEYWWRPYTGTSEKPNIHIDSPYNITVTDDYIATTEQTRFYSGINIKPGTKSWEITARFMKMAHGSNWTDPISLRSINSDGTISSTAHVILEDTTYSDQCRMWAVFSTDGSSWNYSFSQRSIPFNEFWYHRIGYDTTKYYYYISQDGISWTTVQEASSTTPIYGNSWDNLYAFFGVGTCQWIYDLANTYVKVDGKLIWTPYGQSRIPNYQTAGQLQYTGTRVTGFSLDNYICIPEKFVPDEKPFEMCFKFKTDQNTKRFKINGTYSEKDHILPSIQIDASGYIGWAIPNEAGTLWQNETYSGTAHIEKDTWYWVKLVRNASYTYTLYISTDGYNYTEALSYNGTKMYNATKEGMCIGTDIYRACTSITTNLSLTGTLDLSGCYIKIDGNDWWTPFNSFI